MEEQIPIRALGNQTLVAGSISSDTRDPPGTITSGEPIDDAGAAPGLGSGEESETASFGPEFPGTLPTLDTRLMSCDALTCE